MKNILHITYDLRGDDKTTAVSNLINQTKKLANVFIADLVRVINPSHVYTKYENHKIEINQFGLPYGLFLVIHLNRVAKVIENELRKNNISNIDVVHAHKLSFEGLIAFKLAQKYNLKLLVTIRQTDFWVAKYRPDFIKRYKDILRKSDKIFYLLPFMLKKLEALLGKEFYDEHVKQKLIFLPNIVERELSESDEVVRSNEYLTIARMTKRSVKRKNLFNLLHAIKKLDDKDFKLNIVGDGEYLEEFKKWVTKNGMDYFVNFLGYVPNNSIDVHYKKAAAFLMPSLSESFGMVYPEALLNGTPIMYSKDVLGFDGIFENVGVGVNPHSVNSILEGIIEIKNKNVEFRKTIKDLKEENAFDIFSEKYIYKTYNSVIKQIDDKVNTCNTDLKEKLGMHISASQ